MNAKDISTENLKMKILAYGSSGTGKTTFACCFLTAGKVFVADFDGGMLSQRGKDIDYENFETYFAFQNWLSRFESSPSHATLVVDSVSTLQNFIMKDILTISKKKRPTKYEWGVLIEQITDLIAQLTSLPCHVIVIAHEQVQKDELLGGIVINPLVAGKKLPGNFPIWFDEVYRFQINRLAAGKPTYIFQTVGGTNYEAKSRLRCLEPTVEWSKDGKVIDAYSLIMQKLHEKK